MITFEKAAKYIPHKDLVILIQPYLPKLGDSLVLNEWDWVRYLSSELLQDGELLVTINSYRVTPSGYTYLKKKGKYYNPANTEYIQETYLNLIVKQLGLKDEHIENVTIPSRNLVMKSTRRRLDALPSEIVLNYLSKS